MKLVYQIKIINDEGSLIRLCREIESFNLRFAGTVMMLLIADRIEQDGHLYPFISICNVSLHAKINSIADSRNTNFVVGVLSESVA